MTIFKFKDGKRCRAKMQAMWPGGVIMMYEDHCRLRGGHDGPHRGQHGTVWDNADRRISQWEEAHDTKRKLIVLAK